MIEKDREKSPWELHLARRIAEYNKRYEMYFRSQMGNRSRRWY